MRIKADSLKIRDRFSDGHRIKHLELRQGHVRGYCYCGRRFVIPADYALDVRRDSDPAPPTEGGQRGLF